MTIDEAFSRGLLHDLDRVCGSPMPEWLTAEHDRFRWLAARELAHGIAVSNRADPAQVNTFVTISTRSIFANSQIATSGGGESLASMLVVKLARDAREEQRRSRRQRRRRLVGVFFVRGDL